MENFSHVDLTAQVEARVDKGRKKVRNLYFIIIDCCASLTMEFKSNGVDYGLRWRLTTHYGVYAA